METLTYLMPLILTLVGGFVLLLLSAFTKLSNKTFAIISLIFLFLFFLVPMMMTDYQTLTPAKKAMMNFDAFGVFFSYIFFLTTAFVIVLLPSYLEKKESSNLNEIYPLLIFSFVGTVVLSTATNFIMFFLGLELMSICFYILCGILREQEYSIESSLKYFILGVLSTSILLFGIGLIYGSTSSFSYDKIADVFSSELYNFGDSILLLGFVLLLTGLFFKLSLVPFHFWAPDVYQGAPTPVTALLSVSGKGAAVAATMRLYVSSIRYSELLNQKWLLLFSIIGLLTIFAGSFIALTQTQFKRLLAYSSIVHAGFLSLALGALAGSSENILRGEKALAFYVATYLFMNVAAFAGMAGVEKSSKMDEGLLSFSGLGTISPMFSFLLMINFLSLAGIPPTGGFFGKFYIFANIILQHTKFFYLIATLGILGTVIAAFYYLKVLVILYFPNKNQIPAEKPSIPVANYAIMILCTIFTLILGVYPQIVFKILGS